MYGFTSERDEELDEILEDVPDYNEMVFWSLLYFGSKHNDCKLPTNEKYILSEVANGTIDYLTGNGGKVTSKDTFMENLFSFVHPLWDYFRDEIKASKKKIDSRVKNAIIKMVHYHGVEGGVLDRPYPNTGIDSILFMNRYKFSSGFNVGSLSYEIVKDVETNYLPLLSDSEKRDIEGVGKCMKKYIDEDIKHLKW